MKTITSAIQAILDADQQFPVTTVVITLNSGTVLRIADRAVTISAQAYAGDLASPPSLVVDGSNGIDHVELAINNGDQSYSSYDNSDYLDGATVTVSQYFATTAAYTTFEGPVLAFSGVISQPTTSGEGVLRLTVLADARVSEDGAIGRTITGRCLNTFGDANCGYDQTNGSATVATAGTYSAGTNVPLSETPVSGQTGTGFVALRPSTNNIDRVHIKRAGVTIYGTAANLYIASAGFGSGNATVQFNLPVTLAVGDKIIYADCPRDAATSCARRWKIGSSTRQQDAYMGLDYLRRGQAFTNVTESRFDEQLGSIIPIAYGQRWVEPLFIGLHQDRDNAGVGAWNSSRKGPFVIALISEGPVDSGIANVETDVELDGKLAADTQEYSAGVAAAISVKTGDLAQTVSDFAPLPDKAGALSNIPGWAALRNIAYAIFDLPDEYDVSDEVIEYFPNTKGSEASLARRNIHQPKKPALRFKVKGRKVYTWSYSGSTPTKSGSRTYSANPVWQLLDLLTSAYRVAPSDAWSAGVAEADLDLASFIDWANFCDETVAVYDQNGNALSTSRYVASLYHTSSNRGEALKALLDSMRGSLVPRRGKVGLALDAPMGGKGTATAGTTSSLTDSRRGSASFPTVPSWPTNTLNGGLAGLKIKLLSGTGAGQVRTIASNTKTVVVPTVNFSPAPDATTAYAVYAVEITTDNCGNVVRQKPKPAFGVTNKIVAQFEADVFRGRSATLPVLDNTHIGRFGVNEASMRMTATTSWSQAARHAWFALRKGLDCNRTFELQDVNITGLPLEVGDLILFSHDIDGVSNETARVERIEDSGESSYKITASLYREHIYVDWPNDSFQGLAISSNLVNPHSVPPHVVNLTNGTVREDAGSDPIVVLSYDLPQWPYSGASVLIEARVQDPVTLAWGTWSNVAISQTSTASFRASKLANYQVRAVFVSHAGIRADAAVTQGTSSGSNSTTTLNDTTRSWEVDRYTDLTLSIESGTGSGQERTIASNTAIQMTVTAVWGVTPNGTSVYKAYTAAPSVSVGFQDGVDCNPVLDEDDGAWYLRPNKREYAESVIYVKTTDGSTPADPKGSDDVGGPVGTVSTSEDISLGVTSVLDGQIIRVKIKAAQNPLGTGVKGTIRSLRGTFHEAGNRPEISWLPYQPTTGSSPALADSTKEGIRFISIDDSAVVNFGYAIINEGAAAPTWPGSFTLTGLVADPVKVEVAVTRPAVGAANKLIYYQAVDADGNLAFNKPQIIKIDSNADPSGWMETPTPDAGAIPQVIVNTDDSDTGSYRFKVFYTTTGDNTFPTILFNDSDPNEFHGTNFGALIPLLSVLDAGFVVNITYQFYRTTNSSAASQAASIGSVPVTVQIRPSGSGGSVSPNQIGVIAPGWESVPLVGTFPVGYIAEYRFSLNPGTLVQSIHVAYDAPGGSSPLEYDYNISVPELHYLRDSVTPTLPATFLATSDLVIIITPYDAVGGAAGAGSPGPAVTIFTGEANKNLAGTVITDVEGNTFSTDQLLLGSRGLSAGVDPATGRAQVGLFFDAGAAGLDMTASVNESTGLNALIARAYALGGGKIYVPGQILVTTVEMMLGVELFGDGFSSVIKQAPNSYTLRSSGTSTGSNAVNYLNDTGKTWTTNEHLMRTLVITSGPLSGQKRVIIANTATRLTVGQESGVGSEDWASVPGSVTYEIREGLPLIRSLSNSDNSWKVTDLRLDGNKANQSSFNPGIYAAGSYGAYGTENFFIFRDIIIKDVSGWSFLVGGSVPSGPVTPSYGPRSSICDNVVASSSGRHAFFTWPGGGTDWRFTNCIVAGSGQSGFICNGVSHYTSCKAYGCGTNNIVNQGSGFLITIETKGYELHAQENWEHGFHFINADDSQIYCTADANRLDGVHFYNAKDVLVQVQANGGNGPGSGGPLLYDQRYAVGVSGMSGPSDTTERIQLIVSASGGHTAGVVDPALTGHDNDIIANNRRIGTVWSAWGDGTQVREHFSRGQAATTSATSPVFTDVTDFVSSPPRMFFQSFDGTNTRHWFTFIHGTTEALSKLIVGVSGEVSRVQLQACAWLGAPNSGDPVSKGLVYGEIAFEQGKYLRWEKTSGNTLKRILGFDGTSILLGNEDNIPVVVEALTSEGSGVFGSLVVVKTTNEGFQWGKTGSPATGNPYYVLKHNNASPPVASLTGWDGASAVTFMTMDYANNFVSLDATTVNICPTVGSVLKFFATGGASKGTVTGSRGGNAALASVLTLLASYGLFTDSST